MDDRLCKSVPRKRTSKGVCKPRAKRVCIEDFFEIDVSAEVLMSKFQNQLQRFLQEDIELRTLKAMKRIIKKLKNGMPNRTLEKDIPLQVVKKLTNYIKDNFARYFHLNHEWDLTKWKSNWEITLEASLVCVFLLSNELVPQPDCEELINDTVFFLRKTIDDVNMQLTRTKDIKSINDSTIQGLLLENISFLDGLIKNCTFGSLNMAGLITSLINTVLYYPDLDVQMAALLSVVNFYKKGDEFQALILNLTFNIITKIHEHYKFKKKFKINEDLSVSVFTILIISLVDNATVQRFDILRQNVFTDCVTLLKESVERIMKVSRFIIKTFINKLDENNSKAYALIFNCFVSELIDICNEPEWPSARLLLNLLLKPSTEILMSKLLTNTNIKILALKILGEVIKKQIYDRKAFTKILDTTIPLHSESGLTRIAQEMIANELFSASSTSINNNCLWIHGLQWFDNIKQEVNSEEKMANLINLLTLTNYEIKYLGTPVKRALIYFLDTTRPYYADHRTLLKYVLWCCFQINKKLKSVAVQYVYEISHLDVALLSMGLVSKVLNENLSVMPKSIKERMCGAIETFLSKNPNLYQEYGSLLVKLIDSHAEMDKKYMELLLRTVKKSPNQLKIILCRKILNLIQNPDPNLQKLSVDFFSELWLDEENQDENVFVLLEIAEIPNAAKNLKMFFQEKFKPGNVDLLSDTPSQPPTQTVDQCKNLVVKIMEKIKTDELKCLQCLSILVMVCPSVLEAHLSSLADILIRPKLSDWCSVEILSAEVMNHILFQTVNRDELEHIKLREKLIKKMKSEESLNYPMGLIVSLLKVLNNLSKFNKEYLYNEIYLPGLQTLTYYHQTQITPDNRIINKSLCIVIYLYPNYESMQINNLLQYYIDHKQFGLTTIHCLCYLSMDYKYIMGNAVVMNTIHKHLMDKNNGILLKGVLYNILCSLKNINNQQIFRDGVEIIRNIIQKHIQDILACATDNRPSIRQISYAVIRQILICGLILESKLVPTILSMSTDPVDSLSAIGMETIVILKVRNIFEYVRNATKCLLASLAFNLKCSNQTFLRGYEKKKEQIEARCNHIYKIFQEDVMKRREIIDSIMGGLSTEAPTNAVEKLYLSDHVVYFSYKYQDEVFYVLYAIIFLCSLSPPNSLPEDPTEQQKFIDKYYGIYMLNYVKASLMNYYGFNDDKIKNYYQYDGKKDPVQTKKYIVHDVPQNSLPGAKHLAETIYEALKKTTTKHF